MKTYTFATILGLGAACLAGILLTACGLISTPAPTLTPTTTPSPTATPTPTPLPLDKWLEEGNALLLKSDFAGAEAAYQRILDADPEYGPAYIGLSWVYYWQVGLSDETLAQAQKAVALLPNNAEAHAILALAYMDQDRIQEAVETAEQAAQLDPQSAFVQAALARIYLLDLQYEAARQAAEEAVTLDPKLAEAYHALGRYYWNTADFSRAYAAIKEAIALQPEFAPWYVVLGEFQTASGKYDAAQASFEQSLTLAVDYPPAVLGLARAAMGRRDYKEAEAQIQRAMELIPDEAAAYVTRGYLDLLKDEPDEAMLQFRTALEKDEDDRDALVGVGWAYLDQKACDSGARQFQDLITKQPRFVGGYIGLGFARLCDEEISAALENFRKALDLDPYSPDAQIGLGSAYALQERWEEATKAYVKALRLSADGVEAHTYLGHTFAMQNEVDAAKAEYEIALMLDENAVDAHLGLSQILLAEGKSTDVQTHTQQVLSLEEDKWEAQLALGTALLMQGKTEEAIEILQQVAEEEPENGEVHLRLGLAYRDVEKFAQAKKELETYLALSPEQETRQLQYLIKALGQGYYLEEQKAVDDLTELLKTYMKQELNIGVEEIEGERTLVVALDVGDTEDQSDMMFQVGMVAGGTSYSLLRIDPPIDGGLLIHIKKWGRPLFDAAMKRSDIAQFTDGYISPTDFASRFQLSQFAKMEDLTPIQKIKATVSELREIEAEKAVSIQYLQPDELHDYFESRLDTEGREEMQTSESLLELLGVIEPDVDLGELMLDLYTEQVAGFYDPDEKIFYLVERGDQSVYDQITIAHEYVHALQDQSFGLTELDDDTLNSDQRLAFRALVEGDATLATYLYTNDNVPMISLLQFYSQAGGFQRDVLDSSPEFIQTMQLFPYQAGLQFVVALYESGGWSAVGKAYDNPPQSTEQILHPERYREKDKPQDVAFPRLTPELTNTWREVENDVLGELGLKLALAQYIGPAAAAQTAEGWGGDRFILLQRDDQSAMVLRIYWDNADEADEFQSLYQTYMAHRAVYTEEVKELIGEVSTRWWTSEDNTIVLNRATSYVDIIIGPDEETVEQILQALTPG